MQELVFYRRKGDKTQTHALSADSWQALQAYRPHQLPDGPLLRRSLKDGSLTDSGLSVRAIRQRVRLLGKELGISKLSPHDCRHYWATNAARARRSRRNERAEVAAIVQELLWSARAGSARRLIS